MLNPNTNMRELAYVARITKTLPIEGADNIELVQINDGWWCIAKIGEFVTGDLCVYFEIDSKLPEKDWSEFLAAKHYKVKTMKLGKFKVVSQGLALPISAFGWEYSDDQFAGGQGIIDTHSTKEERYLTEGDFLTERLGVTYSVVEDNERKGAGPDKYKKMAQRNPELFKKPIVRWLMKRQWGKNLMFLFFGKKKDKRSWPQWVVKTDEERVQNMTWILNDKSEWFATEKIDGTSSTYTMRGFGRKREFYICSRNVCFDTPEKMANGAWYDTNVYQEMAIKYDIENVLADLLDSRKNELDFVTIQGETYGDGIQKRAYGLKNGKHDLMVFNLIFGYKNGETKRFNPREMTEILSTYKVPCVPIVDENFVLPDTLEELLDIATDNSKVDGGMREGLVFRSKDGVQSFKAVSNEFLLKYHQ